MGCCVGVDYLLHACRQSAILYTSNQHMRENVHGFQPPPVAQGFWCRTMRCATTFSSCWRPSTFSSGSSGTSCATRSAHMRYDQLELQSMCMCVWECTCVCEYHVCWRICSVSRYFPVFPSVSRYFPVTCHPHPGTGCAHTPSALHRVHPAAGGRVVGVSRVGRWPMVVRNPACRAGVIERAVV